MIKQSTIERITATARVDEVIDDFVTLRRRGVNMIGLCPFHDEKTPSFIVSPAKNIYKCFGCGRGGDSVRFMMEHESMTYPEALRYLAQKYNIEIEETQDTAEEKAIKDLKASYLIINEFARDYYQKQLFETNEGRAVGLSYFRERGYNEATIKKFHLGYIGDGRDDFTKYAVAKKFNLEFLKALGFTSKMGHDFFRSRVMFAIHNLSGKVIGFAGRTLSSSKKVPKYINSPETDIYNKRKILYGMYYAKSAIRKNDECILVEGYTDVITLHQHGLENVVASSGTSLTVEQISLIRRFTPNIKIIYDGDAAGIKASLRGLDLVLEQGLNVKLVPLPEGEDPDSFMKSMGLAGFSQFIQENEKDFLIFKTELLLDEAQDDPIKKSIVLKDIVVSLAKIKDSIKRQIYVQKCSGMMGIAEHLIISEINKVIRSEIKQRKAKIDREARHRESKFNDFVTPDRTSPVQSRLVTGDDYQERDILRVLICFGNEIFDSESGMTVAKFIFDHAGEYMAEANNDFYREVFDMIFRDYEQKGTINIDALKSNKDERIRNLTIDFLTTPYTYAKWEERGMYLHTQPLPEENFVRDATQAVKRLLLRKCDLVIKEAESKILELSSDPNQDHDEELAIYMEVHREATKERAAIAKDLGSVFLK